MLRFLPFLFLVGVALEIASIIWIGGLVGVLPTLLLLFAGGMIGIGLFRSAGANMLQTLRSPIQQVSLQQGLAGKTMLRVASGFLFIIPGFFSDIVALFLLLPPVRNFLISKFKVETFPAEMSASRRYDTVIEAEAIEITGETEAPRTKGRDRQ